MRAALVAICVVTLFYYTGVYMWVPVLPLYANTHGASTTQVGLITGLQLLIAATAAIPMGLACDRWGRRAVLLTGIGLGVATSFVVPLVTHPAGLLAVYAIGGLGFAAFNPSAMSLVGDLAPARAIGRAYAWFTTALYAGFGLGPVAGGAALQVFGFGLAFATAGLVILASLVIALRLPRVERRAAAVPARAAFSRLRRNRRVWAGLVATLAGLGPWGAVLAFFPLMARERGVDAATIGLVIGAQALASTVARVPAGWLVDRVRARKRLMIGPLLVCAALTALVPWLSGGPAFVALAVVLGAVSAVAFVAIGATLAEATTIATRGLAMGGYNTAVFGGIALTAMALGPLIARWGYGPGFAVAGLAGAAAVLGVAMLWGPDTVTTPSKA